jgi:enolase
LTTIADIHAREVLDSRGNPTVEVDVRCRCGAMGRAIVPSGASTGEAEAHELRDGDPARYDGAGVLTAVAHVNETIRAALVGLDATDQQTIDARLLQLDDTPQKTKLGANALLGVSLGAAHAGAAAQGVPLYRHLNRLASEAFGEQVTCRMPLPMTNMISGGLHAGGKLDFQDFLISPLGAPNYAVSLEWIVRVYRRLGELLREMGYEADLVGDEGGYGPDLTSNLLAADLLTQAIDRAGLKSGSEVSMALDVAASQFFDGDAYRLSATGDAKLTSGEMIEELVDMVDRFPITSIEDGLAEEDWDGWRQLTARLGDRIKLVGDDLFATNAQRVQRGIDMQAANAVLIKVNQIGTLSETLETMRVARSAGFSLVVSARSGETEDSTIADLAVATAADQIKIGSIVRSERLAKYNRLLRIEEELGA